MTSLLDSISSSLSPHSCIMCCNEGNVLCENCQITLFDETLNQCWHCSQPARFYETCSSCLPYSSLDGLFVIGAYKEQLKEAVRRYRYNFAQQLAQDVTKLFTRNLPYFEAPGVTFVPSSNQHRRQRGFDQGALLAKTYAHEQKAKFFRGIERLGRDTQVNATREERAQQAKHHFVIYSHTGEVPETVFLFDDVVTTGASMNRCAELLKAAGAQTVFGVTLARNVL